MRILFFVQLVNHNIPWKDSNFHSKNTFSYKYLYADVYMLCIVDLISSLIHSIVDIIYTFVQRVWKRIVVFDSNYSP